MLTTLTSKLNRVGKWLCGRFPHHAVWIPVKPVPASRPRVSRNGTHYSPTYETWRRQARQVLKRFFQEFPLENPLFVITEVICPKPKSTRREYPRGDTDNFEKAVWDSITSSHAIWADDDQIVGNLTWKRYAGVGEEHGVRVLAFPLGH